MEITLLTLAAIAAFFWFTTSGVVFRLSVRKGRVLAVQGRVSPHLLDDIAGIVARDGVTSGTITAMARDERVGLRFDKRFPEGTAQRIRNVVGLTTSASLRAAPPIRDANLGQRLGIAWLAWWLDDRRRRPRLILPPE